MIIYKNERSIVNLEDVSRIHLSENEILILFKTNAGENRPRHHAVDLKIMFDSKERAAKEFIKIYDLMENSNEPKRA